MLHRYLMAKAGGSLLAQPMDVRGGLFDVSGSPMSYPVRRPAAQGGLVFQPVQR